MAHTRGKGGRKVEETPHRGEKEVKRGEKEREDRASLGPFPETFALGYRVRTTSLTPLPSGSGV